MWVSFFVITRLSMSAALCIRKHGYLVITKRVFSDLPFSVTVTR